MFKKDSKFFPVFVGISALVMFLGCFLVISFSYQLGVKKGREEIEKKYQAKIEEIFPLMPEQEEIFSVFGEIKEVQSNLLIVQERIDPPNPFGEIEMKEWRVNITDATELVKRIDKNPEEMLEETVTLDPMDMPMPFREEALDYSELEAGQEITIEAGENIKEKTGFEAKKIIFVGIVMP